MFDPVTSIKDDQIIKLFGLVTSHKVLAVFSFPQHQREYRMSLKVLDVKRFNYGGAGKIIFGYVLLLISL